MAKPPNIESREDRPSIGRVVLVRTTEKIGGQVDHAAIITQVFGDDLVNVTVFPSAGQPYPIASISRIKHSAAGSLSWRFPPR